MSGVAYESIGQLERGERKARPSTIRKLAEALGVKPAVLFAESTDDAEHQVDKVRSEQTSSKYDRQVSGELLKDRSLAELAELAESTESPEIRQLIRAELEQRPRSSESLFDPDFGEWVDADRSFMEWYVAGRERNRRYRSGASGATMNGDLAIARAKLNSGIPGELEESVQLATRVAQQLVVDMAETLETELKEYEALPDHYFEGPSAARRIGEIGASMASSQLQDLKMLREFIDIREQALLKAQH